MSANQIYFGALAWASRDALERALASSLLPSPEHVRREVGAARRGESALMFTLNGSMPSSWFYDLGGAIHRLAESAVRGRVAVVYSGDGDEFSMALAQGPDKRVLPSGALPTQRWLALNDRGQYVRSPKGFEALAKLHFSDVQGTLPALPRVPSIYYAMVLKHRETPG